MICIKGCRLVREFTGSLTPLSFIFVFLVFVQSVHAFEQLPQPIDIPQGPVSAAAPGGGVLPQMTDQLGEAVPAIAAISDVTFPDETLVITGDNLEGAYLRIWAEGRVADVSPLRTADNKMQAIVPKDLPLSTMLVWPLKGEAAGSPIRVNGATAWWAWPARAEANRPGQTLRVFGKNLKLGDATPGLYIEGPGVGRWLSAKVAEPYHIEAELPGTLSEGMYRVWAHNGTGGHYGWSESVSFEVKQYASLDGLSVFSVDTFGAKPDDGQDDWEAITAAVKTAETAGGGIVQFSAGTYHVSRPIRVGMAGDKGVNLRGAGMGQHTPQDHKLQGIFTAILRLQGSNLPKELINLSGSRSGINDITLINGSDGQKQSTLSIHAADVVVERVRVILLDERPNGLWRETRVIDSGALFIDSPGAANIVLRNSEVHAVGPGVLIGNLPPGHNDTAKPEPSTNFIHISSVMFHGYYAGESPGPKSDWARGRSAGVAIYNAKNVVVEKSDFVSVDRFHAKILVRTILVHNSSARELYFANNKSINVGPHTSAEGTATNQGEQYLFHLRYPQGGLFDVINADAQKVSANTANIQPLGKDYKSGLGSWGADGSRVLDEVGENDHWILFVCAGKGVGQFRIVSGMKRANAQVTFNVTKPWRIIPNASSRVNLMVAFRHNIIYRNIVDGESIAPKHKTLGVLLWYSSFENIIANNILRNLSSGVVINSTFRNPTGWNLIRNNTIENITGYAGGSSLRPAFYVHHYRCYGGRWPLLADRVWYSVGNIARSNFGETADVAAYLHARFEGKRIPDWTPHPDGGIVMDVIENNIFLSIGEGIDVASPASWALLRNNLVTTGVSAANARALIIIHKSQKCLEISSFCPTVSD